MISYAHVHTIQLGIYLYLKTDTWVCEYILHSNVDISLHFHSENYRLNFMQHGSKISNIILCKC